MPPRRARCIHVGYARCTVRRERCRAKSSRCRTLTALCYSVTLCARVRVIGLFERCRFGEVRDRVVGPKGPRDHREQPRCVAADKHWLAATVEHPNQRHDRQANRVTPHRGVGRRAAVLPWHPIGIAEAHVDCATAAAEQCICLAPHGRVAANRQERSRSYAAQQQCTDH